MIQIFGIKNCDTVKKALKWLEQNNIEYAFHNFKTDGLSKEQLLSFADKSDWATLINKRSTTYKQLPDDVKDNLTGDIVIDTVLAQPTLLKRPILLKDEQLYSGFKADIYQEIFAND